MGMQTMDMPGDAYSWSNWAPLRTSAPAGVYQLAVVEFASKGGQWSTVARLGLMDGVLNLNFTAASTDVWTTNSGLMVLPTSAASTSTNGG